MFKSDRDDSMVVNTDDEYDFFDYCEQNNLAIEVTHKVGTGIQRTQGYVSGFFPELSMFALKGRQGYDYIIPIKNVEVITISGKS